MSTHRYKINDGIGIFSFNGADGTQFIPTAAVGAQVDNTVSTSNVPGRLIFYTSAGGANNLVERMRIASGGNVGIGTTTPGAKLEVAGTLKVDTALVFPERNAATECCDRRPRPGRHCPATLVQRQLSDRVSNRYRSCRSRFRWREYLGGQLWGQHREQITV